MVKVSTNEKWKMENVRKLLTSVDPNFNKYQQFAENL